MSLRVKIKNVLHVVLVLTIPSLAYAADCPKASRILAKAERMAPSEDGISALLDRAIALCPKFASAHYMKGVVAFQKQDFDAAKQFFEKSVSIGGEARYANGLGQVLLARDEYAEAKKIFERNIEKFPNEPQTLQGLSVAQFKLGQFEEARQTLQRAIQLDGSDAALHYNLGAVYEKLGSIDAAEVSYQSALQFAPRAAAATQRLAGISLQKGNTQEAQRLLDSLDASQKGKVACAIQAGIFDANGSYDLALETLNGCSTSGSDSLRDVFNRAILLTKQGQYDEAEKLFLTTVAQDSANAAYQSGLGWYYVVTAQWDRALTALLKATALSDQDPNAFYNLGLVYEERGAMTEARSAYRRAIELRPDVRYYKAKLKELREKE